MPAESFLVKAAIEHALERRGLGASVLQAHMLKSIMWMTQTHSMERAVKKRGSGDGKAVAAADGAAGAAAGGPEMTATQSSPSPVPGAGTKQVAQKSGLLTATQERELQTLPLGWSLADQAAAGVAGASTNSGR